MNDVWGFVSDSGEEYALVGTESGFSVVTMVQPNLPNEVHSKPGPNSIWRDIKVWGNYAYVSNEEDSGLLIVNLSGLPASIQTSRWTGNNGVNFTTAHNLFIDEKGLLYITGANYLNGGVIIADLTANPASPNVLTVYDERYVHDCFARGDTLWTAEINDGSFSVVDISNTTPAILPSSAVMSSGNFTPGKFAHHVWLNDAGTTLFTTDEIASGYIASYDVTDLSNITELDRTQSTRSIEVIPHNTFTKGNLLYASHYRDGVVVYDATYPENLVEIAWFDTSPLNGYGFDGCWGVYPYMPSGHILATDVNEGLFILHEQITPPAYLQGVLTDSMSGAPIPDGQVEISNWAPSKTSSINDGSYRTGTAFGGQADVIIEAPRYFPRIIPGVTFQSGQITTLDVRLLRMPSVSYTVKVQDDFSGSSIEDAHVHLIGMGLELQGQTDGAGNIVFSQVPIGSYTLRVGKWGHISQEHLGVAADSNAKQSVIRLERGYYDDFMFDFNWTRFSSADAGDWAIGEPHGIQFNGNFSNPELDAANDLGSHAYVTGNGPGGAGSHDVDNGQVVLRSNLMDLEHYNAPRLKFELWFFDDGGFGPANDTMRVYLLAPGQRVVIAELYDGQATEGQWVPFDIRISDFLMPSDSMQLEIVVGDDDPGHIVEGGFDHFRAVDSTQPPVANFSVSGINGCRPFEVQFQDHSTNSPTAWLWTLPGSVNGTYSDQNPLVVYDTTGTFDVTLKVSNAAGSDSLTFPGMITVVASPSLQLSQTAATMGNNGKAIVKITGGLAPYAITWNDPLLQSTDTAVNLTEGWYTVYVSDDNGCAVTDSIYVEGSNAFETPEFEARLYPNPTNGQITIDWQQAFVDPLVVRIISLSGSIARLAHIEPGAQQLQLEMPTTPGLYLVELSVQGERLGVWKLVRE